MLNVQGVGFKVSCLGRVLASTKIDDSINLFTHLRLREDGIDLFGFLSIQELSVFELLNSVSGVGPKSAMAILNSNDFQGILAAIQGGRSDLLIQAGGIGKKLADRIILELKNKVSIDNAERTISQMESDADLIDTLTGLGYRKDQVKAALAKVEPGDNLEQKLKAALKLLSGK